jgi:hypothetical protein
MVPRGVSPGKLVELYPPSRVALASGVTDLGSQDPPLITPSQAEWFSLHLSGVLQGFL